MTPLTEIKAALAEITPWPWFAYYFVSPRGAHKKWHIGNNVGLCQITFGEGRKEDYELMAHAPQWLSDLVQRVEELELELGSVEIPDDWNSEGD
jgi:hypothetical protein